MPYGPCFSLTHSVFYSIYLAVTLFRCVLASLYEGLSVRPSVRRSVGPSVRPSVGWSVTLSSKTLENNIFDQNIVIGILGPLDASSQLQRRSTGPSVCQSVDLYLTHPGISI